MRLGILTGLAFEARIARRIGGMVACSAGRPERATAEAERLIAAGCTHLLSFGIAGGIEPGLRAGALLVATAIAPPGAAGWIAADPDFAVLLARRLPRAQLARLAGAEAAATTPAAKAALRPALAVDLESHRLAAAAQAAGVAWGAVRAVADDADSGLPPAALAPLDDRGEPQLGAVLGSLLVDPRQLPALLRLAGATARARTALVGAARELARGL